MSTLRVRDLSVRYGKRTVLSGVELDVSSGEIVALLGENGCGKTTLLRAIQGSIPRSGGEICVNAVPLSGMSPRRRATYVTMMPQEHPSVQGLTGRDLAETAFYPRHGILGATTAEENERLTEAARQFGIERLLERELSELSAGERQLLGLLRAAVQDTPVLLLDEPSSALDFNHTNDMFELLHLLAERGRAILIVLHDPTSALRHADALIRVANGTTEAMLREPSADTAAAESFLRELYPDIAVNRTPLFCYRKNERI